MLQVYQGGLTPQDVKQEQATIDSREVAKMVGKEHKNLLRDIKGYLEILGQLKSELTDSDHKILGQSNFGLTEFFIESTYTNSQNKKLPCYLVTRKGCEFIANKLTGEKGVLFTASYINRFHDMEQHIKQEQAPGKPAGHVEAFEMQLLGAKYAAEMLRVDETSKIRMLETVHKQHGVATNHLPSLVDAEVTKSLTTLLRENGIKTATAKVNTKLIELGLLEIKERPGKDGSVREFKSLTEKGLKFGKNLISPKSPRETQPHYYESTFPNLLKLLGLSKSN